MMKIVIEANETERPFKVTVTSEIMGEMTELKPGHLADMDRRLLRYILDKDEVIKSSVRLEEETE